VDTTLLLCAGKGERWGEHLGGPKQLAPVAGEPILHRLVRLLRLRGARPIIVINDNRLTVHGARVFAPAHREHTMETLLSTRGLWHGRVRVFCGDVVYSTRTLDRMWNDRRPLSLFGRQGPSRVTHKDWDELFGIAFDEELADAVAACCHRVLDLVAAGRSKRAKLREFHRAWAGLPAHGFRRDRRWLRPVRDHTDDIDTPPQFVRNMPRIEAALAAGRVRRIALRTAWMLQRAVPAARA
jgi:molybdopterin-guanine dinucleotide biosynthesis protein A